MIRRFILIGLLVNFILYPVSFLQENEFTNLVGMEFLLIQPGTFMMGALPGCADCEADESPAHRVTIGRAFYIGRFEVTQEQWQLVMGSNVSKFKNWKNIQKNHGYQNHPIENVSWLDVQEFLKKLNQIELTSTYRLPTEAEWEYVRRAGGGPIHLSEEVGEIDDYAWYEDNSKLKTHPVGKKKPNIWGLYDLEGNVSEWCQDWYDEAYYRHSPENDPAGPESGLSKVFRGSNWGSIPAYTRATDRLRLPPNYQLWTIGFRVVKEIR